MSASAAETAAPTTAPAAAPAPAADYFTVHYLTREEGTIWSWSAGGKPETPEASLPYFVWPPSLNAYRPSAHAYSTTNSKGGRSFGFVLAWAGTLPRHGGEPDGSALVLLSKLPIHGVYEEALLMMHERLFAAAAATTPAPVVAPGGSDGDDTDGEGPSPLSSSTSACSLTSEDATTRPGSANSMEQQTPAQPSEPSAGVPTPPSLSAAANIATATPRTAATAATATTAGSPATPASPAALAALCDSVVAPLLRELHRLLDKAPQGLALRAGEERGAWCGEAASLQTLWQRLRGDASRLLHVLLAVVLEYKVLLHCSDLAVLFRSIEALRLMMQPLEFCGALVPFLPQGLHPDVRTLLCDSVEPFLVGMHSSHYAYLRSSLSSAILVVDLDMGTLTGCGVEPPDAATDAFGMPVAPSAAARTASRRGCGSRCCSARSGSCSRRSARRACSRTSWWRRGAASSGSSSTSSTRRCAGRATRPRRSAGSGSARCSRWLRSSRRRARRSGTARRPTPRR